MKDEATSVIAAAQQRLAEAEASTLQALGHSRAALALVEEENRKLRREALDREMRFYTEGEFAQRLKVSKSTLQRLRLAHKLEYLLVGQQVRYSEVHIALALEVLTAKAKAGRKHNVNGRSRIR